MLGLDNAVAFFGAEVCFDYAARPERPCCDPQAQGGMKNCELDTPECAGIYNV